jgi:deazaflavin-dependent oxidoreductase (nitroreductase family)
LSERARRSDVSFARSASSRGPSGGFRAATGLFNRLVLPLAGTRLLPLYGVIEHRGRRSGRLYRTPVVVRSSADGLIVPMPWGEGTDWCRNVRAAGGCRIRWRGRDYELTRPEVVAVSEVEPAFGGFQRAAIGWLGIRECLRLRLRG